jgi:hypothetical protein
MVDAGIETLAADLANGKYRTLDNSLRWRVFPATGAAHTTFVNYDGTSATAGQSSAQFRVKVEHSPVMRSYEVILSSNAPPPDRLMWMADFSFASTIRDRARKQGWWMDSTEGTLHVLFVADDFLLDVARS